MNGLRAAASVLAGHADTIGHELAELHFAGPRAQACTRAALSVVLAVTLAQLASLDDVWWAGISGMMASQATRPASMQRAVLRVAGTAVGALLGCAAMALLGGDRVALCLFLFVCGTAGVLGMSVARHGYVWLFGGLTATMIVLMAMNDPSLAPGIAEDRLAQVTLGCLAAALMAWMLAPPGGDTPAPEPPGWSALGGAGWPAVRHPAVSHAVRSGLTIMVLPIVWTMLELPSLTQMAITVAAVMAVPVTGDAPAATAGEVAARAVLRLIGCLCGGVLGLLCLALPLTLYPFWLALLFSGTWLSAQLAASTRGVAYAGTQAAVVFIVTLVQGSGPPDSILPGIDRFAGIGFGLVLLLVVGVALWPDAAPPPERSGPLRASGYHGLPDR